MAFDLVAQVLWCPECAYHYFFFFVGGGGMPLKVV